MRYSPLLASGLATAVCLISLLVLLPMRPAVAATASTPAAAAPDLKCTGTPLRKIPTNPEDDQPLKGQEDPFKGSLIKPDLPPGLLPIAPAVKSAILEGGLPCQEDVSTNGQEIYTLDNLQRGFDFYSWRTFIALNSPADGTSIEQAKPNTRTRWEDGNNFKELLDVMLPASQQPPKWPTDRAGMEAERKRLMPEECLEADRKAPGRMIVKMIEESFNEPFKTGPLIDQQGHYAIFDILMNRQMFQYIRENHLYSKALQAGNSGLSVDFPPGDRSGAGTLGAFMLKVSWKILSPQEIAAGNFHMVDALVLMPPNTKRRPRFCLPETLGLVGFHAVHKTLTRPQWIWTTFEHVNNVPDSQEVATGKLNGRYNFYNADCKACEVNATPPRPWDPDPDLGLRFRSDDSFKSQIVRKIPLTNGSRNMNRIFQAMLSNTVWKNYMLVSTQWPSAFSCTQLHSSNTPKPQTDFVKQPDMTCSPAPAFLANSTLETYSQGKIPLASSSCIACHGNAVDFQKDASPPRGGKARLNESDFTFILEKAK